jgi:hypothetical protein
MASFTDNIQSLTNFKPYVQQLPIEEMVAVGQNRQAKYDQGVQKIQSAVDNVAGLDVGRDVDKKYLESKLSELQNNLKSVAAGDFSNYQLVKSTAGMANSISKDPIIQAGVYSSANDKKQLAELEKDRQSGKLTPQAELYYQLKRNAYYNNESLTGEDGSPISFSGKYIQSWDIDKNLTEAIKSVGDSKWTTENVFKTDPTTGQPLKDKKTGMPIYSEFAIKEIREGRFSENVSAAINTVLSRPEAKQELAMRGVYNYRGYTDINQFIEEYKKEADKAISLYEDKKIDLATKMALTSDPAVKKQYQDAINKIDSEIQTIDSGEDAKVADAEQFGSLEAYKAALQTRKTRNEYMQSGVTERTSKEYVESIPYKVQQDKIKADRDWYMANADLRIKNANLAINQANSATTARAQALKEEQWKYDPKNPNYKPPTTETGDFVKGPVVAQELYADLITKASDANSTLNSQKREFIVNYLKTINYSNGKNLSDAEINKQIKKWSAKDPNFIDVKYNQWKKVVGDNAGNVKFAKLATMLPQLNNSETNVAVFSNQLSDLDRDPRVIAESGKGYDPVALSKGLPSVKFSYTEGAGFLGMGGTTKTAVITPNDIINLQIVHNEGLSMKSSAAEKTRAKLLKEKLQAKFGEGYVRATLLATDPRTFNMAFADNNLSQKTIDNILNAKRKMNNDKFSNSVAIREKVLQEKGLGNAPLVMSAYGKDAKGPEIASVNERIKSVLGMRKDGEMDVAGFSEAFKDPKTNNINFSIDRDSNKIKMSVYDATTKVKEIEISKSELDYIKGSVVTLPSVVSNPQRIVNSSTNKTTNYGNLDPQSPNAYRSAYIKENVLAKKFNRTDIKGADVILNYEGVPNVYIYHHDKSTGEVSAIPYKVNKGDVFPKDFASVDAALAVINKLSSGDIDYLLNNSK